MLFSYKELKRIAKLSDDISINEVTKAIDALGFEVEGVTSVCNMSGLQFGKVNKVYKNPNGEKLNVCEITFKDADRVIQTTAKNVSEGMVVVAFVPGSMMGDIEIKEKKMKEIVSEGMLTSLNEFFSNKMNEFFPKELTDDIYDYAGEIDDINLDPSEVLGLNDFIIDVSILSNRPDANSYLIMALELSAYFGINAKLPKISKGKFDSKLNVKNQESKLSFVEVRNFDGITTYEKMLLVKSGVKIVNAMADLTNLVLIMTGQPSHAYNSESSLDNFDTSHHTGKLRILGNQEIECENTLVITSNNEPISIAGVMGLEDTKWIKGHSIVEMGIFNIKDIRESMKTVKLATNSGVQSSKNLGIGTIQLGMSYLSNRVKELSNVINFHEQEHKWIEYSENITNRLAGFDIVNSEEFKAVMTKMSHLGFEFKKDKVLIPFYRYDIFSQQDIDEEIFRYYGYDNFVPKKSASIYSHINNIPSLSNKLVDNGFTEINTYSLISEAKNTVNLFDYNDVVKLKTFVSKEREIYRSSLINSVANVATYNLKRKITQLNIFDTGYINKDLKVVTAFSTTKSFLEMKQILKNIMPRKFRFEKTVKSNILHPNLSADIFLDDNYVGSIGRLHPSIFKEDHFFFEVVEMNNLHDISLNKYDTDPLKTRDINLTLEPKENIGSKLESIQALNIFKVKIIDKFIKDGKTIVTIRCWVNKDTVKLLDSLFNE